MPRFRKRPVEVEAIQWTGDNLYQMIEFTGGSFFPLAPEDRGDDPDARHQVFDRLRNKWVNVYLGQWVLKGRNGEFCPIAEDELAETYESVEQPKVHVEGLVFRSEADINAAVEKVGRRVYERG